MRTLLVVLAFLAAMFLVSCGKKPPILQPDPVTVYQTVETKVPVPVKALPPAELLASHPFLIPVFVAPSDPLASSALTAEGERLLRGLIEDLYALIDAWKAWATAP